MSSPKTSDSFIQTARHFAAEAERVPGYSMTISHYPPGSLASSPEGYSYIQLIGSAENLTHGFADVLLSTIKDHGANCDFRKHSGRYYGTAALSGPYLPQLRAQMGTAPAPMKDPVALLHQRCAALNIRWLQSPSMTHRDPPSLREIQELSDGDFCLLLDRMDWLEDDAEELGSPPSIAHLDFFPVHRG